MSLLAAANSTSWERIRLPFDWVKWETALSIPQFSHTLKTIKISRSLKISYGYRFGSRTGSQLIKQETWCQSQNVCVWGFFSSIVSVKTWREAGQMHSTTAICKGNWRSVNLYEILISDANHGFVPHNFASDTPKNT